MQEWNTDWDPYEALKACEHNVHQLILAVNNGTEVMKDLANKYNHQQEVINQLMFQNRKLQGQLAAQTLQIQNIINDIKHINETINKAPI